MPLWREGIDVTDSEMTILYVLGMCQRAEHDFTLKEIIARVMDERPEIILQFPGAWGELIRSKRVKISHKSKPFTYQVVIRDEW
jgi:hypothetical protein